jgi:broad specificity phosphatase PhoE
MSPSRRTIEIRRHAERHKPGDNLNARGVARARNASARDRDFALVVTSPIARAIQTAVAMGHSVDKEDWTMASMGVAMTDFPWDDSFAAMQQAIRTDRAAAAYAELQALQLRAFLARVQPGQAVLVVNHGGIAEAGVIGLLGDADAAPLGRSFDTCEGARLELDGDRVVSVRLLRYEGDREVEVDPGYSTPNVS